MSFIDKWMKNHVGILFATLECEWEFDMGISSKKVAYSCMWVALYIQYCIQHRVSSVITTTTATCLLAFKTI
jgi:hypothetical protein